MNVEARTSRPGEISSTVVGMLQEELEATNRENMLLTLELEQRVAERTVELAISNRELLKEVAERIRAEAEIKDLNRTLERRAALLETANEELEAFSSSVSHDLRNPLSRILGFALLLQDSAENLSAEKPQRHLANISSAVHQMSALIDDLLRLSYSSRAPLVLAHMDLNQVVTEVIAEVEQGANPRALWNREPLPSVFADRSLLRQVLVNLLSNAVKYSRKQSPPKIDIGAVDRAPDEWTIFVHDNGVGFDAAKADRLFNAFQRLHSSAEFEGTGIGLANVRRIVLRHGGKVWAESHPDQGATFYFSLPKQEKLAAPAARGSN